MQFHAIVQREARGYSIVFVDAPGCQTCADHAAEVAPMAQDAVEGWVEAHLVTGTLLPERRPIRRRLPAGAYWLTITIPLKISVRAQLMTRRLELGLSQAQMAARMNVTRQAYQQLESPDANLRLDTLTRAFDALEVAPVISLVPQGSSATVALRGRLAGPVGRRGAMK
jgi:DNA-binding XRE family transcriptional regulator/predicted RNase H-like HicB family nuclease